MSETHFRQIEMTVNGTHHHRVIDVRKSLLEVLREDLGLTGTKLGCGVGECGACSVVVDDVLVDACIYLAVWTHGRTIRTIEGEAKQGRLSPVQQAYVTEGAVQCGFCTPGFVMATTAFVEQHKGQPVTDDTIRKAHAGNLCRCTGYQHILDAVKKSMKAGKNESD
jgi:aerobic-type carbon monoxide dehydrogenase small subunit (CoxS/CutS family)